MGRAMCSAIGSADGCQGQVHLGGEGRLRKLETWLWGEVTFLGPGARQVATRNSERVGAVVRQVGRDRGGSRVLVLWSRPFGGVAGQLQRNDCIETIVF